MGYSIQGAPKKAWAVRHLIEDDDVTGLKALLDLGLDPNSSFPAGGTLLKEALKASALGCVRLLLESGADTRALGALDFDGDWGLLNWMARAGKVDCFRVLAQMGVSVDLKDDQGWAPLGAALSCAQWETVEALRELGAGWAGCCGGQHSPLMIALEKKNISLALELDRLGETYVEGEHVNGAILGWLQECAVEGTGQEKKIFEGMKNCALQDLGVKRIITEARLNGFHACADQLEADLYQQARLDKGRVTTSPDKDESLYAAPQKIIKQSLPISGVKKETKLGKNSKPYQPSETVAAQNDGPLNQRKTVRRIQRTRSLNGKGIFLLGCAFVWLLKKSLSRRDNP